jgi:hypothetical protein
MVLHLYGKNCNAFISQVLPAHLEETHHSNLIDLGCIVMVDAYFLNKEKDDPAAEYQMIRALLPDVIPTVVVCHPDEASLDEVRQKLSLGSEPLFACRDDADRRRILLHHLNRMQARTTVDLSPLISLLSE